MKRSTVIVPLGLALLLGAASMASAAEPNPPLKSYEIFREGDVSVTADLLEAPEPFLFSIHVRDAESDYLLETYLIAVRDSLRKAEAVLANAVRKIDDYLFVRAECGGGNAWGCETESVFLVRGGRLTYLGDIRSKSRDDIGSSYSDGLFVSGYNKFESNDLTSHGGAPWILVHSRVVDGRFVPDLAVTWKENHGDERIAELRKACEKADLSDRDLSELRVNLLNEAVLAAYCRRSEVLREVLGIAEARLRPIEIEGIRAIVDDVIPGEFRGHRARKVK